MIGMLKVAKNGNDLLQILDALTDTNEEVISSDAVDFSGQSVNFWYKRRGVYFAPFCTQIYKDYPFFILKMVLKMYLRCLSLSTMCVEKYS